MLHTRDRQRSWLRTVGAFLMIVGHILAPWRRPWRVRWGADTGEPDPSLPGEDAVPGSRWDYTHAISIPSPPPLVWPWIAQLGQGRGGFYTFERLENIFGCQITNAETILPEFQNIETGDEFRIHPKTPALKVEIVVPGRSLVLRGKPTESTSVDALWAFHVLDDGAGGTRLIERGKYAYGDSLADRMGYSPLLIEPIGFVMSREMLLGIKQLVIQSAS